MQLCSNMAKAVICVLLASLFACCRSAPVAFHGGSDVICPLTVKILDAVKGTPAGNIALDVYRQDQDHISRHVHNLITEEEFTPGVYRVEFDTKAYWKAEGRTPFHQVADVSNALMALLYSCTISI
uniref:Transthyretin/hydroxyisourate hydrolase domain-containing protein n=1 Tax=Cyprinus carpio TaxID=7962 RepID=A0A8C2D7X0_CYPCA